MFKIVAGGCIFSGDGRRRYSATSKIRTYVINHIYFL